MDIIYVFLREIMSKTFFKKNILSKTRFSIIKNSNGLTMLTKS